MHFTNCLKSEMFDTGTISLWQETSQIDFPCNVVISEENPYRPSYELPSKFTSSATLDKASTLPSKSPSVAEAKKSFEQKRDTFSGKPKHGKLIHFLSALEMTDTKILLIEWYWRFANWIYY